MRGEYGVHAFANNPGQNHIISIITIHKLPKSCCKLRNYVERADHWAV